MAASAAAQMKMLKSFSDFMVPSLIVLSPNVYWGS
jgi:hypothetical protein